MSFWEWVAATPWSVALHESSYLYLMVLTVHVTALCVFAGLTAVVDLRLLGLMLIEAPASEVVSRLRPFIVAGFATMVVSGLLLFYAAPLERYENVFFRAKMVLLVLAGANVWVFHRTAYRRVSEWDLDPAPPRRARLAGGLGLAILAAIILAGRMIPYQLYWFG